MTVTVTDVCPECSDAEAGEGDHFDMNALAYNQISPMTSGRIDVNYRLVACSPASALKVDVNGNSGPGAWLRLLVTVSALPHTLYQASSFWLGFVWVGHPMFIICGLVAG